MKIIKLISGPIDNNMYIAYDNNKNCVIIDAPFDGYNTIKPIMEKNGLNEPQYILITHTHWDHIGGLAELKRKYPKAKICVHNDDVFRLSQPTMNLGGMEVSIEMVKPDVILKGKEEIKCGDMLFDVFHTPGHSPGAVCFSDKKAQIVFAGDTLFRLSIGRTDFAGCDYATLINSIKTKLWNLTDDTKVYCGHNEDTTIGYERKNNPFLKIDM